MYAPESLQIDSPRLQRLHSPEFARHQVSVSVLRLDEINPLITGNKWFKLKLNLEEMGRQGHTQLLSFGGAYSNHLMAVAAAGQHFGLRTIGVIRGELVHPLNPALQFAVDHGMTLTSVSRSHYREKDSPEFIDSLKKQWGEFYLIPEGGSNALGVKGCEEIAAHLQWGEEAAQRKVALACGTGATMAGLLRGLAISQPSDLELIGVAVLKAPGYMAESVSGWLSGSDLAAGLSWRIDDDSHFGGYARTSVELDRFIADFSARHGIPLEPVYTGKLFWRMMQEIRDGRFSPGTEIILIHSGGFVPQQ